MNSIFLILLFIFTFSTLSFARPEYAEKTGKECIYCHVTEGGGKLTKEGELFLKNELRPAGIKRIIRIIVYYFHFLFGILWFGTILYVHIILKPGYASKGLPRGELMLGWISIVVMGITGTILTFFRIESVSDLISTFFGIVLSLKILLYVFMVSTAFVVTFVLGPKLKKKMDKNLNLIEKKEKMTLEELGFFDGKEGRECLIAYKGEIFDLSSSRLWHEGVHMGRHHAGIDLTDALKSAPHNEKVLERFQKVGDLVTVDIKKEKSVKVFFALAYTNLVIVFLVIFLITLWKW